MKRAKNRGHQLTKSPIIGKLKKVPTSIRLVIVFALIGGSIVIFALAATSVASIEPENATLTGNAQITNDGTASGGKAVVFNAASQSQPFGNPLGRTWSQVFNEDFNGTTLDTSKWVYLDGWGNNNVTMNRKNCSFSGGNLVLALPGDGTGCQVSTIKSYGAGVNARELQVGDYVEGRIWFPGPGTAPTSTIYNWPAFWAYDGSGNWDAAENDIAEAINTMQYHYHSTKLKGDLYPSGQWGNSWHVYAIYRQQNQVQVFWDGALKGIVPTNDNGGPEGLIINSGKKLACCGAPEMYGPAANVLVDWVRIWR